MKSSTFLLVGLTTLALGVRLPSREKQLVVDAQKRSEVASVNLLCTSARAATQLRSTEMLVASAGKTIYPIIGYPQPPRSLPESSSPYLPKPGDLLINEILSNPAVGGVEFVEIYNHSQQTIDLRNIYIAAVNASGRTGTRRRVSETYLLIHPGEYRVLTTQPAVLEHQYPDGRPQTFIRMSDLPNFNNETGGVVLYDGQIMLDSLFYTPDMHSPFLTDHRGISLERQWLSSPALTPGNFRSAAVAIGGATPGYRNSQYIDGSEHLRFSLASKVFSPDGDGVDDWLEIRYELPEGGYMANIAIFNDRGLLVKRLFRNQHLASRGTVEWDGKSDQNRPLPIGIYIVVIEIYHESGFRKTFREAFALAVRSYD